MTKIQVIETALRAAKAQVKAYLKANDLAAMRSSLDMVKSLEEQKVLLSGVVVMVAPSGETIKLELTRCYVRLTVLGESGSACFSDDLVSLVEAYIERGYKIKL